ncbi:MAG: gliding motility lipoprotein GldH, partial [Bacteroidota bacterium]|nr:gliding motility lipoprotein GldH [Bacteroidota bacterium]
MYNIVKIFFALLIATLISSCDSSGIYDEYNAINKNGWAKSDKQYFNLKITDSLQAYNFIFNIRNNNEYPYRN